MESRTLREPKGFRTLREFKKKLQKAIDSQSIEKFEGLIYYCPFSSLRCTDCPIFDKNGPRELVGASATCLLGSMTSTCWNYDDRVISKKTALANLVLMGIKLLAYLESEK